MNRRLKTWLLVLALWTLPGMLTASFNALLFPRVLDQGPLLYFSALTGYWLIWAVLTPFVVFMARHFPLERSVLRSSLGPHLAAMLVCACAYVGWYVMFSRMLTPASEKMPEFWTTLRGNAGSRIAFGILLYAGVVAVTLAMDERASRRTRELQGARLQAQLSRAQLQALQMQLQPHFLFNTLHAISMLVQENPAAATRTITQLGDLLRKTLALADVPEVSLREELSLLQQYIDIEQTRFGDHLTVNIDVPDELMSVPVPSLVLQPLVENAIRHGISQRVQPGNVFIRAWSAEGNLNLEVRDDGPGFPATDAPQSGTGLRTTSERLDVLYGNLAGMSYSAGSHGAQVLLTLPMRHA